jgi:NAD(P)-dependent dehydrogenase (short-subunit alcohol dehydrogenase family)
MKINLLLVALVLSRMTATTANAQAQSDRAESSADFAAPVTGAYSSSKAALRSLTRIIAAEMLERESRVNAVAPGPIKTPILARKSR